MSLTKEQFADIEHQIDLELSTLQDRLHKMQEDLQELKRAKDALQILRKRLMPNQDSKGDSLAKITAIHSADLLSSNATLSGTAEARTEINQSSLVKAVASIVRSFGPNEFTRPDIDKELKSIDMFPGGKNPEATVAYIVGQMAKRNQIVMIQKGKGSNPNVYIATKKFLLSEEEREN